MKKEIKFGFAIALFFIILFVIVKLVTSESFTSCGLTFQTPWLLIKNSSNGNILYVDKNGNLYMNSTNLSYNTAPPSNLVNSLIIKSGSTNKFSFNPNNTYISGTIGSRNNNSINDGNGNDLIVKNNAGAIVAHFDGASGNIHLKGDRCPQVCGDNFINDAELCDGSDLGGNSCASFGCSSGPGLLCNPTCNGFDTPNCINC